MWLSLYILALAALAVHAPDMLWQPQVRDFVMVLAVLGAWRYGWGAVHLARGMWCSRAGGALPTDRVPPRPPHTSTS